MFRGFKRMPNEERGVPINSLKAGQLFVFHEDTSETQVYMVLSDDMRHSGDVCVPITSLIGGKVVFHREYTHVHPVEALIEWKLKK